MSYVVDTNVWLESLLGQDRADEADAFLSAVPSVELALTDFSLYSIGIILTNLGRSPVFDDAYQYVAALPDGRQLVTFDRDFQRTDLEGLTPKQALTHHDAPNNDP